MWNRLQLQKNILFKADKTNFFNDWMQQQQHITLKVFPTNLTTLKDFFVLQSTLENDIYEFGAIIIWVMLEQNIMMNEYFYRQNYVSFLSVDSLTKEIYDLLFK